MNIDKIREEYKTTVFSILKLKVEDQQNLYLQVEKIKPKTMMESFTKDNNSNFEIILSFNEKYRDTDLIDFEMCLKRIISSFITQKEETQEEKTDFLFKKAVNLIDSYSSKP